LAPQIPAEFLLEVTMEAYERARIFPPFDGDAWL